MVPIFQNILFIAASVAGVACFTRSIYALVWALLLASCLQVIWLLWYYRQVFPALSFNLCWTPAMRRTLFLMGIGVYATSVSQLSVLVDTRLFSAMPSGSMSWFYYAERLSYLPQGLFGAAIATVLTPTLVASVQSGDTNSFQNKIDWGLTMSGLVGVPCALGLYQFAEAAVTIVYYSGRFSWHDIQQTTHAVQVFAWGVPAFLWCKVLTSAFYAQQRLRWPAVASTLAVLVNLIVSVSLAPYWHHVAIAYAIVAASYTHVAVLWLVFFFGRYDSVYLSHGKTALRILTASSSIFVVKWAVAPLSLWLIGSSLQQISYVGVVLSLAGALYFFALKSLAMPLDALKV